MGDYTYGYPENSQIIRDHELETDRRKGTREEEVMEIYFDEKI